MLKNKILLIAIIASTLISGCVSDVASAFLKPPTVAVTSITPKNMSNGQMAFDVGLKVHNPNPLPLPISKVSSSIALNGLSLLSASGVAKNTIPAGGDGQVTMSANLGRQQINQLLSTLKSPNIDYDLKGNVGVMGGNMNLPIQQKGTVNVVNLAAKLLRARLSM